MSAGRELSQAVPRKYHLSSTQCHQHTRVDCGHCDLYDPAEARDGLQDIVNQLTCIFREEKGPPGGELSNPSALVSMLIMLIIV